MTIEPSAVSTDEPKETYVAFVLDESGSMNGKEESVIKGFNDQLRVLQKRQSEAGSVKVALYKFGSPPDSRPRRLFRDKAPEEIRDLSRDNYNPSMWTPLNDAVAMAINELLGWGVLAIVLGIVGAAHGGGTDPTHLVGVLGGTVVIAALAATVGRRLVTKILWWMDARGLPSPASPLSLVVCLGLLGGITTGWLGIHPVFGFLLAGLMAGDPRALSDHTRSIIAQMVEAVAIDGTPRGAFRDGEP